MESIGTCYNLVLANISICKHLNCCFAIQCHGVYPDCCACELNIIIAFFFFFFLLSVLGCGEVILRR